MFVLIVRVKSGLLNRIFLENIASDTDKPRPQELDKLMGYFGIIKKIDGYLIPPVEPYSCLLSYAIK